MARTFSVALFFAALSGTGRTGAVAFEDPGVPADPAFRITLASPVAGLDLCDSDDDGVSELLVARERGLDLCSLQRESAGQVLASFPVGASERLAWCVGDNAEGGAAVFVILDRGEILRWSLRETEREPVRIHENADLALPLGCYHLGFVQDLRGRGTRDLALPERGGVRLLFHGNSGYEAGPRIRSKIDADSWQPSNCVLGESLGQSVHVPAFSVEDQNGDGFPDLLFGDTDRVRAYWSGPDGSLPEQPTFELDLEQIRKALPNQGEGTLDPKNVLTALQGEVTHEVLDLDDDGKHDLLLRQGPKVAIFAGARGGIDRSQAKQVLKTGGNLLAAFSYDENADGKRDLCMLQIEDLSLAQILFWLVAGGSLQLDLYVYHQEEPLRFSRRPSSVRTLKISFPPVSGIKERLEAPMQKLSEQLARVPVRGDLDGGGLDDDVALLEADGRIEIFLNVDCEAPAGDKDGAWLATLRRFDAEAAGRGSVTVELEDLMDWTPFAGRELRDTVHGRTADRVLRPELAADAMSGAEDGPAVSRCLYRKEHSGRAADALVLLEFDARTEQVHVHVWNP